MSDNEKAETVFKLATRIMRVADALQRAQDGLDGASNGDEVELAGYVCTQLDVAQAELQRVKESAASLAQEVFPDSAFMFSALEL